MLLATLIYLKPKMHNVANISAFALFFVNVFTYGQSIGCIAPSRSLCLSQPNAIEICLQSYANDANTLLKCSNLKRNRKKLFKY